MINKEQAIEKIARELGKMRGSVSLPKIFPELVVEEFGYKVSKQAHINTLLRRNKNKSKRMIVLQKVFSLHSLSKTIGEELRPAINRLGFDLKSGVVIEIKNKKQKNTKGRILSTTRKYSKDSSLISVAIYRKGEKLSSAYLSIYLIENHLRLYIWKKAGKSNRKLSKFLSSGEKEQVKKRKAQESKTMWFPLRRDSNLFYLDIDHLGSIIQRNWSIFETDFPEQQWISSKIREIAAIRNRVAHNNSYISDTESKLLELYIDQIFSQLR